MISKYRVHEVAKDFNIKSNIVVDLLAKYFDGQKKHMTALEEDELDVIFETFTKENQTEDLNEYFLHNPDDSWNQMLKSHGFSLLSSLCESL